MGTSLYAQDHTNYNGMTWQEKWHRLSIWDFDSELGTTTRLNNYFLKLP